MEESVESGLVVINCPTKEGVVTFVINLLIALNSGIDFLIVFRELKFCAQLATQIIKRFTKLTLSLLQ